MSDGDYLPGEPMPRGAVPAEPPGVFRDGMHTHYLTRDICKPLNVCIAPGIDPGRIRLIRQEAPPVYEEAVASLSVRSAFTLGRMLIETALGMMDDESH